MNSSRLFVLLITFSLSLAGIAGCSGGPQETVQPPEVNSNDPIPGPEAETPSDGV